MDQIKDSVDNFLKDIGNNKSLTFVIILVVSFYACTLNNLSNNVINFFSNNYVKFLMFVIISYISTENFALGIILLIALFTTLQIVDNVKIHREILAEKFSPYNDMNDYLTNPHLMQKDLSPLTSTMDFNLVTPDQIYNNMITTGKKLIDDSINLKSELKNRPDYRELKIAEITNRDGLVLAQSGINRLGKKNNVVNFIKFNKIVEDYSKNPIIIKLFNKLKIKYNELINNNSLNNVEFEINLLEIYDIEFELLKEIHETMISNDVINFKKKITKEQNENIMKMIDNIKTIKHDSKKYSCELNKLSDLLVVN
jgi:hypothetical protein